MEEIWALQAEFERAQEAEVIQRLSERNCVEIVLKLIESGRIKLIFSSTGKEFLTPGRLKGEILNEIRSHGGRISITDLPDLLNVDLINIERISSDIVSTSPVLLVNGQLISKSYIDAICSEIAETVLESGMITLSTLSQQFALPIGLIQNELDLRLQSLGQKFNCQLNLQNQRLYTDLFATTNNAKIRGLLLGCTRPVSLQTLISQHGLQEKLVRSFIEDMENVLPGAISGGSNTLGVFTPWVYTQAQKEQITSNYNQNNYIEINALNNTGFAKLAELFPDGILLHRIFISPLLLKSIHAAVLETISSENWIDARTILPSSLSPDDIASIVKKAEESSLLKKASKQYHHMEKVFIVSNAFVKSCAASLDAFIVQLGTQAAITMHQKNNQPRPAAEDTDPMGPKTKKDRSKKRSLNPDSLTRHIRPSLDLGSVQNSLVILFPDCERALINGIISLLAPSFRSQFEKVRDSPHIMNDSKDDTVDLAEVRRKRIKHWILHIQQLSESFQAFSAANRELKSILDDTSPLERYLIQSFGLQLSDGLLRLSVYLHSTSFADDDENALDQGRRSKLMEMLPAGEAQSIISLSSAKSSSEFFTMFQGLAEKCDVKIKDVPKKKLKQISFTLKTRLAEQIVNEQRPEAILLSAILLLLYRSIGMILHAPYSSIDILLDALELSKISKEALDQVKSLKTEIENPTNDTMSSCIANVRSLLTAESKSLE